MLNLAVDLNWLERCPKIRKPRITFLQPTTAICTIKMKLTAFSLRPMKNTIWSMRSTRSQSIRECGRGKLRPSKNPRGLSKKTTLSVQNSLDGPTKAGDVRYVPILDPSLACTPNMVFKMSGRTCVSKSCRKYAPTISSHFSRSSTPSVDPRWLSKIAS